MEEYIRQLKATYDTKLYYFTLMGCMSLIDTCAALNSINGETTGPIFKAWFNKYLSQYDNKSVGDSVNFNAEECYKFRCRLLHQGRSETIQSTAKSGQIIFRNGTGVIHSCNMAGAYILDIKTFMDDILNAVKKWQEDTKDLSHVQQNLLKLIKTEVNPSGRQGTFLS